jgi:hypothetical protein
MRPALLASRKEQSAARLCSTAPFSMRGAAQWQLIIQAKMWKIKRFFYSDFAELKCGR